MCRWMAYCGMPRYLDDLLCHPEHSLLHQARDARKGETRVNADGFGLAWYTERPEPGLYRSITPVWGDENLSGLAKAVAAPMVLAHARATTGTQISQSNCHPFVFEEWSFIHNGQLGNFSQWSRAAEAGLSNHLYEARQGTTDSELLFLFIMQNIHLGPVAAIQNAIKNIHAVSDIYADSSAPDDDPHRITAALSNGQSLFIIRYASDARAPSLFYQRTEHGWLIASEPISQTGPGWHSIPQNALYRFDATSCEPMGLIPSSPDTTKSDFKFCEFKM